MGVEVAESGQNLSVCDDVFYHFLMFTIVVRPRSTRRRLGFFSWLRLRRTERTGRVSQSIMSERYSNSSSLTSTIPTQNDTEASNAKFVLPHHEIARLIFTT